MIADAFRRWKQSRRIARAEAEILARGNEPASPHGLPAPLIISLTSYPARFAHLHLVLRSLLSQSVRADRVILWLDAGDEALLPAEIIALDVEIRICPAWRSYKKIVPTLLEWPDAHVVTADDDVYYGPDWLRQMVERADAGVVCHRAHRVTMRDGQPASYDDWQRNIAAPERSGLIFPTGVGGVLYAPGAFHPDVTNAQLFQRLAPSADDVWLYWMHRLAGSKPAKIGGRFRITEWPGTQEQNLRGTNLAGDGNDRAVRAMLEYYGFPG
ncbi:glycosyltransferase family 2 protein [Paracoccus sp. MBLB3053]|uniref:Glycosyltransferase family 2 protein n=1 Tax=Paracoccus aurantius TaxID=3073814 RepID=A0ABU2HMB4_9RHOB|nr:glycosyltransferase family 2 protein [Paracoccus sp. MBLB3053]MDS9466177.1 glycosyltransferase family 2 protein [Paracoccus sp. MBLB3053]